MTRELAQVTNGSEPWLLESFDQMVLIRRLERDFPLLEEVGCKVGIGVATGADKAFIGDFEALNVEQDRKVPLVTTKDIVSGEVEWRGLGVINPFTEQGGLVDLGEYPLLRRYLEARRSVIAGRHCAQKNPLKWYRTIDRITPKLAARPKLLIPDIKGQAISFMKVANYILITTSITSPQMIGTCVPCRLYYCLPSAAYL
jgi:hypothetical protein